MKWDDLKRRPSLLIGTEYNLFNMEIHSINQGYVVYKRIHHELLSLAVIYTSILRNIFFLDNNYLMTHNTILYIHVKYQHGRQYDLENLSKKQPSLCWCCVHLWFFLHGMVSFTEGKRRLRFCGISFETTDTVDSCSLKWRFICQHT